VLTERRYSKNRCLLFQRGFNLASSSKSRNSGFYHYSNFSCYLYDVHYRRKMDPRKKARINSRESYNRICVCVSVCIGIIEAGTEYIPPKSCRLYSVL
jgi:hypothetical protein